MLLFTLASSLGTNCNVKGDQNYAMEWTPSHTRSDTTSRLPSHSCSPSVSPTLLLLPLSFYSPPHILHAIIHSTSSYMPHHTARHTTHCRALDKLKRQIKAAKDEKKRVRELIAQGIDPATVPAPNQTVGEQCYHLHLTLATTSTL